MDFFFHRSAHAAVKSAERKGLVRQRTSARLTANVLNRYYTSVPPPLQRTQQTNSDSGALLRRSAGDRRSRALSLPCISTDWTKLLFLFIRQRFLCKSKAQKAFSFRKTNQPKQSKTIRCCDQKAIIMIIMR